MEQQLINWLRLAFSYGVGPATTLKLLQHFGSVENILSQDQATLQQFVSKGVAASILGQASLPEVEKSLAWVSAACDRYILTLQDSRYPTELAEIAQPPLLLFAEGDLQLLTNSKLAVVGTRHPTPQGISNAYAFAHDLASHNLTIVSGMASGIDTAAHQGALAAKQASTIGVVGTGIDIVYPATNRQLFNEVRTHGLLLSEFNLGVPALNNNFPRRNRIIVGLSKGCLVVESALEGGAMISANFALEMGREVLAIPGSIHNPMARGCHKLIQQGAKLVETSRDILDELSQAYVQNVPHAVNYALPLDPILAALGFEPTLVDVLAAKLNLEFGELCGKLLELELAGEVINCGGGRYQRIFK